MPEAPVIRGFGHSVRRKEDPRFIRGQGNYIDDIKLPGMLYMDIVRSPFAHAKIVSIDTSAAKAASNVLDYAGRDLLGMSERDLCRSRVAPRGDAVLRGEDPQPSRIQVFLHAGATRTLREIGLDAVLAGQETRREREVRDDADAFAQADFAQVAFERLALVQVVRRLQRLVARCSRVRCDRERLLEACRGKVRGPDRFHLALFHEP